MELCELETSYDHGDLIYDQSTCISECLPYPIHYKLGILLTFAEVLG